MRNNNLIIGGGMTGLAAGMVSNMPVYEAQDVPGGICSSYYIKPGGNEPHYTAPEDGEAYRFEIGGGHWIFGGDPAILHFIKNTVPVKSYERKSGVYFSKTGLYVPYPIQNHLAYLGEDIAKKCLAEINNPSDKIPATMAEWIEINFGKTLTEQFFAPFHELYTAGLWKNIAPQDAYKSPVDISLVKKGAFEKNPPAVGYNTTYLYPENGLNTLSQKMAEKCNIHFGKRVIKIDISKSEIVFSDGQTAEYDNLVSTIPLNKAIEISGISINEEPPPYTSVLVLNIGAERGQQCPDDHWLYVPDSESGFHRVGFYSNVDRTFLPLSSRRDNDRVSIYVESAYQNGNKPTSEEIQRYSESVVKELGSWGFITNPEVVHPTWIDVAYTWSLPGSKWRQVALKELELHGIYQIGRYGRWVFQGIADSIKDGLFIGGALGY